MAPKSNSSIKIGAATLQKCCPGPVLKNMKYQWNFDRKMIFFRSENHAKVLVLQYNLCFCKFLNKSENWCKKGCQKLVVDAERHRRTPRLWATPVKTIYGTRMGLTQCDSMRDISRKLVTLAMPAKRLRNYAKMDADVNKILSEWFPNWAKVVPKSRLGAFDILVFFTFFFTVKIGHGALLGLTQVKSTSVDKLLLSQF